MATDLVEVRWLWHAAVDGRTRSRLATLLDATERSRAAALDPRTRDGFVVRRGVLRLLLGRALGQQPDQVAITAEDNGRPVVDAALRFSVSSTHRLIVYAFATDRDVGVDVERVRRLRDMKGLTRRVCTHAERSWLSSRTDADRAAAFFSLWTAKEAVLKATGVGLGQPPTDVEVAVAPDGGLEIQAAPGNQSWSATPIEVAPGYATALVVAGAGWTLSARRLDRDLDVMSELSGEPVDTG
jgi:4'-phosphopantetheinyl transferase